MVKIALLLPERRTERVINKDSGAGANAASWEDLTFNNPSPLYELVWYPREGLRLKYASSEMAEEKATSFWNSDLYNITISSPHHPNSGENSRTGGHATEELNLMTSKLSSEMVDFLSSHTSATVSVTGSLVQELRSFRDMKSRANVDEAVANEKLNNRHSDKQEVAICFFGSTSGFGTSNAVAGSGAAEEETDRVSSPGQDNNSLIAFSKSCGLKEKALDLPQIEANCAKGVGISDGNNRDLGAKENLALIAISDLGDSVLAENLRPVSSSRSPTCIYADLGSKGADEDGIRIGNHPSNLNFLAAQCSDDIASVNVENECKLGVNVAIGSQLVHKASAHHLEKGKGKIIYGEEDCYSISKEREDSNESVESNSRRVITKGKRAQNFDLTTSVGCKRSRRECGGSSSSESLIKKDSSFMNWISSITSSFSRHDYTNKNLAIIPQDSNRKGCFSSIPMLAEKSEGVKCGTKGFASVFQALYTPSTMVQNSIHSHDQLAVANDSEDLSAGHPPVHGGQELNLNSTSIPIEPVNSVSKPHNIGPLAIGSLCVGEVDKIHAEELDQGNTPSTTSSTSEKIMPTCRQACCPKITEPPSSSTKKILICAEENENQVLTCASNNSLNKDDDKENNLFQNLWITRLLRKDSSSISRPIDFRLDMDLAPEKLNNQTKMGDYPHQGINSIEENPENLEDCCASHVDSQRLINNSAELQPYLISPTVSSGSKRPEDQKSNHNLNPILPSQKFKKSEPMASLFAKRLDALRHIIPSKVANSLSSVSTTCFFCGKVGHSLRQCSSIVESDLKNLLEFMKSYQGNELPPSFCIRCFQGHHWAIACPRASVEIENSTENSLMVNHANLNGADKKLGNHASPNYDGRIILWTGDVSKEQKQHDKQNIMAQRGGSNFEADPIATKSSSVQEISPSIANNFYPNPSKEYLSKSTAKSKQKVSRKWDNEAKETEVKPICKYKSPEIDDIQNEIFEAIRRLQLSRTEIMRLLKSPSARIRLEGFFLRLRLGKCDEGLGGTGYHVAQINGVSHENCVSVSIGHLIYSVNCRFVSNQDYIEDELKAWWSATSRGEGKFPSKEDLSKKLKERIKLGL